MKDLLNLRVKEFKLLKYNIIKIILTDTSSYTANIESFNSVYCYPKNLTEWEKAYIGESAIDIEWPTGFGIHLDQIISLSLKQNPTANRASRHRSRDSA